jgi:4-hydroxy-3-polyprenylbenzoate decarboxylase
MKGGLMAFRDLREYMVKSEEMGVLKRINGADCNLEIGTLSHLYFRRKSTLFENIPGYPAGYRVLSNVFATAEQQRLVLGIPADLGMRDTVKHLKNRLTQFKSAPPVMVKTGSVLENVDTGADVNLLKFPAPRWNELDGGHYIGTADLVITRDPDDGWVNFGTYRVMVHDANTVASYMSPGRHGRFMREKYWARGESCPVAIVCGAEPSLFVWSFTSVPQGISEYEYAGWIRGEPVEIVEAPVTRLPIPAHAEIVIEGEIPPPEIETRPEGPFGEWTGYYASMSRGEPVVRVKSVAYRNDPILLGVGSGSVPSEVRTNLLRSAMLWNQMEAAGVPEIKGVWYLETGAAFLTVAISIKQSYPGHARHAGMAASGCRQGAYLNRFIIVVDDDIDPTNENDLWWAVATRCDPATSIDIYSGGWSSPLDPRLDPEKRRRGDYTNSKAIMYACRPYHWMSEFPPVVRLRPELVQETVNKFKVVVDDIPEADLKCIIQSKVMM